MINDRFGQDDSGEQNFAKHENSGEQQQPHKKRPRIGSRPVQQADGPYKRYDNPNRQYFNYNRDSRNTQGRSYGYNSQDERQGGYQNERQGGYQEGRSSYYQPRQGYSRGYQQQDGRQSNPYQQGQGYGYRSSYGNNQGGGYYGGNSRPRPSQPKKKEAKPKSKRPVQPTYDLPPMDPNVPIRLNKFLANSGICSRREADEFIQAGVVTINGEVATVLGTKVYPTDIIRFHGQPVRNERKVYLLLNKPKDCVTTAEDTHARKTVLDVVKNACSERIYPVGRLDRNTTGVLLLTNDGDLASKLTHPKYEKKKIYHVTLGKPLESDDYDKLMSGVELEPEVVVKADVIEITDESDPSHLGVEIHSGQNRVIRRMFEAVGYKVLKLDRVYFAGLTKKGLPRGRYRFLTAAEVGMLQMGSYE